MMSVVIVGRPNVGKSSLFNRIIKRRKAVVEHISGVTRDRLLERAEWRGKGFYLTDTGGYIPQGADRITNLVKKQVSLAIEEGDIILFMVDVVGGITSMDKEVANSLRRYNKKVFLVVNKVDSANREGLIYDFFKLGFEKVFPVSSIHGRGVAELLDEIVNLIPEKNITVEEGRIKIAIVGKPNVGKSSLFNKITQEERVIVDEEPGTTRDAIDTDLEFEGEKVTLIDTAGIRRKPKIKTNLEYYTIKRAVNALLYCDVAMVMIDGSTEITRQDKRLIALSGRAAGCVVILLNKMDLVPRKKWQEVINYFHKTLTYMTYLLTIPISAKSGEGVFDGFRIAIDGYKRSVGYLNSEKLSRTIADAVTYYPHKRIGKRRVFITGCKQVSANPPQIIFYTNFPDDILKGYRRYLEKKIRETFPLLGIPLVMRFRKRRGKFKINNAK